MEPGASTGGGAEEGSGAACGETGEAAVGAASPELEPEVEVLSGRWTTVLHRRLGGREPTPAARRSERRRGGAEAGDGERLEARVEQLERLPPRVRTMVRSGEQKQGYGVEIADGARQGGRWRGERRGEGF